MKNKKSLFLLFPCAIIFIFTVFLPAFITFEYSLKNFKLTEPNKIKFIGFDNYKNIIFNNNFQNALINSLIVLLYVIIIGSIFSLFIALVLNKNTKLSSILTAIVIIPWALPPLVNGIMWKFIFSSDYGLLNKILLNLNVINSPISWINNRWLFLFIISIVIIWRIVPFAAIILLANLQNIPNEYYDSIYLEGSSKWQAFKKITLPLLLPSFGIILINLTTTAINVFDEIIALAGYQFETQTLIVYNYLNTFNFLDFGVGSAISYIIMFITGVLGYLYIKKL